MEDRKVMASCESCSSIIIVMPSALLGTGAQTGARQVFADVHGFYTCPVCGERGQLPQKDSQRLPPV